MTNTLTLDPWLVLVALVAVWWIVTAALLVQARREAADLRREVLRMLRESGAEVPAMMAEPESEPETRPPTTEERDAEELEARRRVQRERLEELERQRLAGLTADSEAGLGRMMRGGDGV